MNLKLSIFLIFLITGNLAFGQCSITARSNACVDDAVEFKANNGSGKSISSYAWKFGDGYTSKDKDPIHFYFKPGKLQVELTITYADGSQCNSTFAISIWEHPKANFSIPSKINCQFTTLFIIDSSKPASNQQKIKNHSVFWSDGTKETKPYDRFGKSIGHKYTLSGSYKIKVEVIDNFGCKNEVSKEITISPGVKAKLHTYQYGGCKKVKTCFQNQSETGGGLTANYKWFVNGILNTNGSKELCFEDTANKSYQIKLMANLNGCKDSAVATNVVQFYTSKPEIVLSSRKYCYKIPYSQAPIAKLKNAHEFSYIYWSFKGFSRSGTSSIPLSLKNENLSIGKYMLNCRVKRGECYYDIRDSFEVVGIKAQMDVYNQRSCAPSTVFFFDSSKGSGLVHDRKWSISDPDGLPCTKWLAKNQNRGSNCNYGRDAWIGHQFTQKRNYDIKLWVKDPVSGCSDSITQIIYTGACVSRGNCLPPTNGTSCLPICQESFFLNLREGSDVPTYYSFDRLRWYSFPGNLPSFIEPGTYPLWFAFPGSKAYDVVPFGNDSFKVIYKKYWGPDTVKSNTDICIRRRHRFWISMEYDCKDYPVTITSSDTNFRAGTNIRINWGDGVSENLNILKDTVIHKIYHRCIRKPLGKIRLSYNSGLDCGREIDYDIDHHKFSIDGLDPICSGKSKTLRLVGGSNKTRDLINSRDFNLDWYLGSKLISKNTEIIQLDSLKAGYHSILAISRDTLACIDTLWGNLTIQKLTAGTKAKNKHLNCARFASFYDSSRLAFPDSRDYIKNYYWSFGDNFSRSTNSVASHLYNKGGVYKVTHAVQSASGCRDTIRYNLKISDLNINVSARDTIGCDLLRVSFINNSTNGSGYVWYLGDRSFTTKNVTGSESMHFTYSPAGQYVARLYGFDSFFNYENMQTYYCTHKSRPISIKVLGKAYTSITGSEYACVNQEFIYKSKSSNLYELDTWRVGSYKQIKQAGDTIRIRWSKPGIHYIHLNPSSSNPNVCPADFSKKIEVKEVFADFRIENNPGRHYYYSFDNLSKPKPLDYAWEISDENSNLILESDEENPSITFDRREALYQVCLIAENDYGCIDTACDSIRVFLDEYIKLANVFTPGNEDGLNDKFDVIIKGEASYHLTIYNRWNQLVFEQKSDDDETNWNGRLMNSGSYVPGGGYFYIFKYSFKSNPQEEKVVRGAVEVLYE